MVLKGILWYGIARHDLVLYGILWYGIARHDLMLYGNLLYGIVWHHMVWCTRHGVFRWYCMVRRRSLELTRAKQHVYNYYTSTLYRLYITAHSPNNSITLHCMEVISRKYYWPFGLVFSSFINTRLRQQLVNNKNHLNGHNFFAGQAESGHLDLGGSSLRLLLPRPPGGDDTWLRGN